VAGILAALPMIEYGSAQDIPSDARHFCRLSAMNREKLCLDILK
jgi:hypothetical protein